MITDNIYYVYSYLREDGSPYYIGKGKNKRAWSKKHSVNLPQNKDNIVIIEKNLSAGDALKLETDLISYYGRKDNGTGILRNKTDGGEGIINPSSEWREQVRNRMKGDNNPSRQPGASKRISESQLRPEVVESKKLKVSGVLSPLYGKFGEQHPRYGKKDSELTRKQKSQSAKGKTKSQSHKDAIGRAHKGIPKPNSGKGNTNVRGKKWFNDGVRSYMFFELDERAANLFRGRLKNE
jgi:hypothetical protein